MKSKRSSRIGRAPSWASAKARLGRLPQKALLALLHDLWSVSQQNRDFISARLNEDSALQPYLDTIERSLYPDVLRSQPLCLGEARRAISTYRKATRDARGVLELRLRLLECGTAYAADFGALDERLANTLSVTLEEILAAASLLTASDQHAIFGRLHRVAHTARTLGWGHYDLIDQSLATARRPPTNQS